ncbi:MAG TPA: guanylate kinase, partial [Beijerinckiaceae bacterium]|nr:guanylate kinase [Beijerinckiaceae bacterium]
VQYDYVLVNDDLQRTYEELIQILRAERLRRSRRQPGVEAFVAKLLAE